MAIRLRAFEPYFVTFTTNTITTSSSPAGGGTTSAADGELRVEPHRLRDAKLLLHLVNWTADGSLVSTTACYTFS